MKRSTELLGTEVAPIVRRGAVKAVTADIWARRFVERNLNMHKDAFTPENAAMLLIDHQSARSLGRIRFNCDELRNITASAVSYRQTSLRLT